MAPQDLGKEFPSELDRAYTQYKKHKKVKEVMSKKVVTITPGATMERAAKIMGEKHIGSLIVVRKGAPTGIVTERDLLNILVSGRKPKEVKIETVMSSPLITINPEATIKEAAQMMIKKKGKLTVFEGKKLAGIITASDLIRSMPDTPETALKVDDFMTKRVMTASEKTTVSTVTRIMGKERIGSVIVTSGGKPMGIFTERDLLTKFLATGKPLDITVGEAASSPIISAPSGISIREAASLMASKHIRRLPITRDGKLAGIITARDLVEAYAK